MPLRILLSLSLLALAFPGASAQPADEFFHGGAQHYLSNNIPAALQIVTNGLQRFPEDEKLKKLYELLNQQQQQQQQKQDQKEQEQKDEQKQDQQKQDKNKEQESRNDQEKQDEQKKQQEERDKKEQEKKEQQKAKPDEKKETGEKQPVTAHQMTPQEAKQLLDAQKDDEQILIFKPEVDPKKREKKLKDW